MTNDLPFRFSISLPTALLSRCDNHIERRLSQLKGQFYNAQAFEAMLEKEDRLIYEVFEIRRPEVAGEMLMGLSVVHPGKVGDEFFMTKGHYHSVLDTAEIYYVLKGEGLMVMETPEGDCAVEPLSAGQVLYVPPRWAHRSVCTSRQEDLVTFFVYPGNAGHNYVTIENKGFRKLVLDSATGIEIIDNPRWNS